MSQSWPLANPQQIIRAYQKDQYYLQIFMQQSFSFIETMFSQISIEPFKEKISLLLYLVYSMMNLDQSIGEEYTYIVSMSPKDYNYTGRQIGFFRKIYMIFLLGILKFASKKMPQVEKLQLGFMMLFGQGMVGFLTKVAQFQLVPMKKEMSFQLLGLFVVLQSVYDMNLSTEIQKIFQKFSKKQEIQQKPKIQESTRNCGLCLDNCTFISCTPCGHIFCWDCIKEAVQFKEECPECRFFVTLKSVVQIKNI